MQIVAPICLIQFRRVASIILFAFHRWLVLMIEESARYGSACICTHAVLPQLVRLCKRSISTRWFIFLTSSTASKIRTRFPSFFLYATLRNSNGYRYQKKKKREKGFSYILRVFQRWRNQIKKFILVSNNDIVAKKCLNKKRRVKNSSKSINRWLKNQQNMYDIENYYKQYHNNNNNNNAYNEMKLMINFS